MRRKTFVDKVVRRKRFLSTFISYFKKKMAAEFLWNVVAFSKNKRSFPSSSAGKPEIESQRTQKIKNGCPRRQVPAKNPNLVSHMVPFLVPLRFLADLRSLRKAASRQPRQLISRFPLSEFPLSGSNRAPSYACPLAFMFTTDQQDLITR